MTGPEITEIVLLTAMNTASAYIPALVKNPRSKKAAALKREAIALRGMLDQLIAAIDDSK
jgi:hypothetical protein